MAEEDLDSGQENEDELELTTDEETVESESEAESEGDPTETPEEPAAEPEAFDIVLTGEEPDSRDDDQKLIPVSPKALYKLRQGKREAKSEADELRREVENLKAQMEKPTAPESGTKPPDPLDFEDDDKYDAAMRKYVAALVNQNQAETQQQSQQQQAAAQIEQSVKGHYDRATTMLSEYRIDSEKYQNSERAVRERLGHDVFEAIVDAVGEGSERLTYFLGNNPAKLDEVESLLIEDPLGLRAIAHLGTLKGQLKKTPRNKQVSQAPPADSGLPGSSNKDASLSALRKELDRLSKNSDRTEFIRRKRQLISDGRTEDLRTLGYVH